MRRGRLPEPGEVLFATSQTTLEELELLLRRWAGARARGHERRVFVVADVHVLSYSSQVAFVERLRALARERGVRLLDLGLEVLEPALHLVPVLVASAVGGRTVAVLRERAGTRRSPWAVRRARARGRARARR